MAAALLNSFETSKKEVAFSILQVIVASLFLAFCSQISIPLFFSPVPITGQTFAIMLIGASLGSRKGLLAVLTYLVEGTLGLPFFAGGSFGLMSLIGLRGGYLLGFLLQVFLVGWFVEQQTSFKLKKIFPVLLLSSLLTLALGALWLAIFVPFEMALIMGFTPFLIGEALKSILIAYYLRIRHSDL